MGNNEGDKSKKNVRALVSFRLKGVPIEVGEVVKKEEFPNRASWQNLLNMEPPRVEETNDSVGKAKKKPKAALPGAE